MQSVGSQNIQTLSQPPSLSERSPIRILHVVGAMTRGGIETWLMHVLRHIDRQQFQMDFLVHVDHPCAYDDEIRALGSRIIPCPYTSQPLQYARHFKQILHQLGPYDIVHSHVYHFSGYVLRLAQEAGILARIAHSHVDRSLVNSRERWYRRLYSALMKQWLNQYGTLGLGCSGGAVADLFGKTWSDNAHRRVLHYGIDLSPFHQTINPTTVRAELGIPQDAFVVGHVGRFAPQKNHEFLVDIVADLVKLEPKVHLLLIGEGALLSDIKHKVDQIGLTNRVTFAGSRSDIPRLMLGAMDVFLLPSLFEGLPVVLIEAQAAGLPCVISDAISEETDAIKPLIKRLSLNQSTSTWANAVLTSSNSDIQSSETLKFIEQSSFNIQQGIKILSSFYTSCIFS